MKKRVLSLFLALCLCMGLMIPACAGEVYPDLGIMPISADESVSIHVTIADAGTLVLAAVPVMVVDADNDGSITINDALICTHDTYFEGGAEAGYQSYESDYGLSLSKLWGVENGGSYGYYLNNASAWSLLDPVKTGDTLAAFTYADLQTWSDTFCWLTVAGTPVVGEKIVVTLNCYTYDESWNQIVTPVANACILADGELVSTTDENGQVELNVLAPGACYLSAYLPDGNLVPPVTVVELYSFADTQIHWAREEIESAVAAGLFKGTDKGFEPNRTMTRAELVTVLYRLVGAPAVEGACSFEDVKPGSYYETPVIWANQNQIVMGSNGKFDPNGVLTREQLAVLIYRFAAQYGGNTEARAALDSFPDSANVHSYAVEAMQWCVAEGLLNGMNGELNPRGNTTRAQVATILMRFLQSVTE